MKLTHGLVVLACATQLVSPLWAQEKESGKSIKDAVVKKKDKKEHWQVSVLKQAQDLFDKAPKKVEGYAPTKVTKQKQKERIAKLKSKLTYGVWKIEGRNNGVDEFFDKEIEKQHPVSVVVGSLAFSDIKLSPAILLDQLMDSSKSINKDEFMFNILGRMICRQTPYAPSEMTTQCQKPRLTSADKKALRRNSIQINRLFVEQLREIKANYDKGCANPRAAEGEQTCKDAENRYQLLDNMKDRFNQLTGKRRLGEHHERSIIELRSMRDSERLDKIINDFAVIHDKLQKVIPMHDAVPAARKATFVNSHKEVETVEGKIAFINNAKRAIDKVPARLLDADFVYRVDKKIRALDLE